MLSNLKYISYKFHQTILGEFVLASSDKGLINVGLPGNTEFDFIDDNTGNFSVILDAACKQLDEYLSGERKNFSIPLDITQSGTKFQKSVWRILMQIPYGKTITYKEVANKLNNIGAARAVGQANKSNPLPIFIPCHRVVAQSGLGGYAGKSPRNLSFKAKLLSLERDHSPKYLSTFLNS